MDVTVIHCCVFFWVTYDFCQSLADSCIWILFQESKNDPVDSDVSSKLNSCPEKINQWTYYSGPNSVDILVGWRWGWCRWDWWHRRWIRFRSKIRGNWRKWGSQGFRRACRFSFFPCLCNLHLMSIYWLSSLLLRMFCRMNCREKVQQQRWKR